MILEALLIGQKAFEMNILRVFFITGHIILFAMKIDEDSPQSIVARRVFNTAVVGLLVFLTLKLLCSEAPKLIEPSGGGTELKPFEPRDLILGLIAAISIPISYHEESFELRIASSSAVTGSFAFAFYCF